MSDLSVLTSPPNARPVGRICSGGCPHFEPVYQLGRKVAGTGTCEKGDCGTPVRVGHLCLWTRPQQGTGFAPATERRLQIAASVRRYPG